MMKQSVAPFRVSRLPALILPSVLLCTGSLVGKAQATFSIVAVDTVNGIVGSAGASCIAGAQIIEGVVEGIGAVNTQAFWNATNQQHADSLLRAGDTPADIVAWLVGNDAENDGLDERDRQYGVVTLAGPGASASHTGAYNTYWAGHRTGPGYAVQGNILIDSTIVDRMEDAFLTTEGPLGDRLMAALQAAKVRGADSRCYSQIKSSISAFIKVVRPGDGDDPFLDIVVANTTGTTDPIDILQDRFTAWRAAQIADADASAFSVAPAGLPNTGHDTAIITVVPLNSGGLPPTEGAAVSLVNSGSGDLQPAVDNGDGSFTALIVSGTQVESDTLRAFVTAGGETIELATTLELLYFLCGDVNADDEVTSADIIYLVNHLFKSGVPPVPLPASADVDRSGALTSADIIFLVNYAFKSGTPPCP